MKYYYLINGKIMSANEKMPIMYGYGYKDITIPNWIKTMQPCDISESELRKVYNYNNKYFNGSNPIEVTDIISDNNGVVTFKPKQVDINIETAAIEYSDMINHKGTTSWSIAEAFEAGYKYCKEQPKQLLPKASERVEEIMGNIKQVEEAEDIKLVDIEIEVLTDRIEQIYQTLETYKAKLEILKERKKSIELYNQK